MDTSALKCEANYYPSFLTENQANSIYRTIVDDYLFNEAFLNTQPNHAKLPETDKVMFMDKWLFEENSLPNEVWGKTAPWFEALEALRNKIEELLKWPFHTGVCIYYPNGNTGIGFHADHPAFGNTAVIASISLGAERIFQLRDNDTEEVYEERLAHGSLFVMGKGCQTDYEHALPMDSSCHQPRINITFRTKGYQVDQLHI
ncbi:alpha-ketoglutarate-dependent dioxygenase AlkB [Roseivirga pacifica]|uniref:alpha-ketoglutarate-dependent dioxygenase AlkB n=1 Tax=Roseivirga pacifica TaxID=1267423 RepID=UPI003BAD267C